MFVKIIGHTGIEDRVRTHPQQRVNMAVPQLGRIADRVGRNRRLSAQVQIARRGRGDDHLISQRREKGVPERQIFIEVQSHRDAHHAARPFDRAVGGEQLPLVLMQPLHLHVKEGGLRFLAFAQRLVAFVAADVAPSAVKRRHRQPAGVGAALADDRRGRVCKTLQRFGRRRRALGRAVGERIQRRAVGAHQPRDARARDLGVQFLLERAQHRVVEEGAALHDDPFAEIGGRRRADDLVQRVLDYADRKTGRDGLHRRAVLLRLLDGGIHKHRAARSEVDRPLGVKPQRGEV